MRDGGPLVDIDSPAIESARADNDPLLCHSSMDQFPPTSLQPAGDSARCQSLHSAGAAAAPFAHSIARVLANRAGSAPEGPSESPRPGRRKGGRPTGEAPVKSDAPRRPRGRPPIHKNGPGPRPAGATRDSAGPPKKADGAACAAAVVTDSDKAALALEGILPDTLSQSSFRPGRPTGRPVGSRPGPG